MAVHSTARLIPTARGRNQLEQASGTIPRRAKTNPIFAPSAASRTSMASVIVIPTPTAGPLMAAITGLVESKRRRVNWPPPSRGTSPSAWRSRQSKVLPPRSRSAPAQNPRPAPVTTIALTPSSASACSSASISSDCMVGVNAFSRSGRLSVIVRTRSATSYWISLKSIGAAPVGVFARGILPVSEG